MAKEIKFVESFDSIVEGLNAVANATKVTLGPHGKNVIIEQKNASPLVTKDGVTVVRNITLKDDLQNIGATLIKDVTLRTVQEAGDGTTTAAILTQALVNKCHEKVKSSKKPLSRSVEKAVKQAVEDAINYVKSVAIKVTSEQELISIATISSNNDSEIGTMIGKLVHEIGKDGSISFEEGADGKSSYKMIDGLSFGNGYLSSVFVNKQERGTCEFEKPVVIITDQKIDNIMMINNIINALVTQGKQIVLIADDFSPEVMSIFIANKKRGILNICPIKAPKFVWSKRQSLEDLAFYCGTVVCSTTGATNLSNIKVEELGTCNKIEVKRNSTTITGGNFDHRDLSGVIMSLDKEIEENKTIPEIKERLIVRKNKLTGKVAVVYVGGNSASEIGHTKDRIDDAIAATRSSFEDGIVASSANTLMKTSIFLKTKLNGIVNVSESESDGYNMVIEALEEPFKILCEHIETDWKEKKELLATKYSDDKNHGYDFLKEEFCNLAERGIIDPAKVIVCALKYASSAALMLATSSAVIVEPSDEFDVFKPQTKKDED